ncbi:MAG: hypothetical protein IJ719_11950 [Clostridia bacterium]|nr:hypothetical protein [Clostridia bacterium]
MSKIKGCVNTNCVDYKKKRKYKSTDEYCVHCGKKLTFVCKDCWMPIEANNKVNYCMRCQAKHDDKADKVKKGVNKAAAVFGILSLGALKKVFRR